MNALCPSPRLLRKIAAQIIVTDDPEILAWADAVRAEPHYPHTSIVDTHRGGRLCGYEVWRHLDTHRADPARHKARLWFGIRRHGARRALQCAHAAAEIMSAMTHAELREWWSEYQHARTTGRPAPHWRVEPPHQDSLDYTDRAQLTHRFARKE